MNDEFKAELPPAIDDLIAHWSTEALPPVDSWHPSEVRDIDMRIAKNGEWFYLGTPIRRPRLMQLFASVLRLEADGTTCLVTPGEKLRIQVDDAHFQAVLLDVEEHNGLAAMCFTTNIGERVVANAQNLIDVKYTSDNSEPCPYVHVRGGLSARLSRAVFLQLCEFAEVRGAIAGVSSCGVFMPLGPAE